MSDSKKLRPLADNILVSRAKREAVTAVGICVPESAQNKTLFGTVIAVGQGKLLDDGSCKAVAVKAGETVLFGKYSGTEVDVDGQELLMLKESDILGVIEN